MEAQGTHSLRIATGSPRVLEAAAAIGFLLLGCTAATEPTQLAGQGREIGEAGAIAAPGGNGGAPMQNASPGGAAQGGAFGAVGDVPVPSSELAVLSAQVTDQRCWLVSSYGKAPLLIDGTQAERRIERQIAFGQITLVRANSPGTWVDANQWCGNCGCPFTGGEGGLETQENEHRELWHHDGAEWYSLPAPQGLTIYALHVEELTLSGGAAEARLVALTSGSTPDCKGILGPRFQLSRFDGNAWTIEVDTLLGSQQNAVDAFFDAAGVPLPPDECGTSGSSLASDGWWTGVVDDDPEESGAELVACALEDGAWRRIATGSLPSDAGQTGWNWGALWWSGESFWLPRNNDDPPAHELQEIALDGTIVAHRSWEPDVSSYSPKLAPFRDYAGFVYWEGSPTVLYHANGALSETCPRR